MLTAPNSPRPSNSELINSSDADAILLDAFRTALADYVWELFDVRLTNEEADARLIRLKSQIDAFKEKYRKHKAHLQRQRELDRERRRRDIKETILQLRQERRG